MFSRLRHLLALFTRSEKLRLARLLAVNTLAALSEVAGMFSILPFLAVAADPGLIERQPLLARAYALGGFGSPTEFLIAAGLFTVLVMLAVNLVGVWSLWLRARFCHGVVAAMSDRLFRGYLARPYEFFLDRHTQLLSRDLLYETGRFFSEVLDPLTSLVARGLQLVLMVGALFLYDWRAAGAVGLLLGGFYATAYLVFQRRLHRVGRESQDLNEACHRLAGDALGALKEVRLFGRERRYAEAFADRVTRRGALQGKVFLFSTAPRYLVETLAFGAIVGFVLARLWAGGGLAEVLPLLGLFAVAGVRLMPALQIVFQHASLLRANWVMVERLQRRFAEVNALASAPALPDDVGARLPLATCLEFRAVAYAYPGAARPVLDGLSFTVPARSCVGFRGESGAGKTTLLDLCLGLISPAAGEIRVDGRPLDAALRRAWQRNVGYVPQHPYLLDASIAANIAFDQDPARVDQAAVERAARLASLHEFVVGLPDAYATGVGERGVRLSGGQRQRIAIARALYHDPEVLVFDEATSALDVETEEMVVESIRSLAGKKTILIVAHRPSTLRHCDHVFMLRAGKAEPLAPSP